MGNKKSKNKKKKKNKLIKKLMFPALVGSAVGAGIYVKKKKSGAEEETEYKNIEKANSQNAGNGQTVLITGASSGIGLEFARKFAENGFDLVITARSKEKLETLADELMKKYGVKVTIITADLSTSDGAEKLYQDTKALGIEINQLVNNAGAGKMGRTVDVATEDMVDLIHLNVISVTILSKLFGADMEKNGYGKILNVSSLGAFIPDPYFNVYGPTKAYELFLTEAMSGELKDSGVTVSVLCPGPTKTNWASNAGKADSKTALDPKEVVKIGYEGMQKGELVIIPTKIFKAEKKLIGLLPPKTQVAVIRKWQSMLIKKEK